VASVPVVVWTAEQETKTDINAYFEKPDVEALKQAYGLPSAGQPQITLVWPFVGKVNDAVLIYGNNFGQNPKNKQLFVGNQLVPEEYIKQWTPELIEFLVPPASSFGPVHLSIENKNTSWPFAFTVYEVSTLLKVTENNNIVWVKNTSQPVKMTLFFQSNKQMETDKPADGLTYPAEERIISVKVTDANNNPLPFFVEPEEFGF